METEKPLHRLFTKCCMRKEFFLVLILFVVMTAVAQDDRKEAWMTNHRAYIDSAKHIVDIQPNKADLCLNLAVLFGSHELDSALLYAAKGIEIAEKTNEHALIFRLYDIYGVSFCFKGDYEDALNVLNRMYELAEKVKNKEYEARAYSLLAFTYTKQGKFNMAIEYYLKALTINEELANNDQCVQNLANIAEINRLLGNWNIAMQYLQLAEKICDELKDEKRYEWRIPQIYNEYAHIHMNQGDYEKALFYALQADSINPPHGTVNRCPTKSILSRIYLHENDLDRALQYALESYRQADMLKDVGSYFIAGKTLSDVYLAQHRYREAEAEALKIWQTDSTNIDESRAVLENLTLANLYLGHTEKVAMYLKKYVEMNAQYAEKSFHNTVSDMSNKYETEKKEIRIKTLEKDRLLYIELGIASVLLACTLAIVLVLYVRNARKKRLLIATEAIQEGEIGERVRIAKDLHDHLGGSLITLKIDLKKAVSLPTISNKLDVCIKELREITNDIMPRSLYLYGLKGALEDFCIQFPTLRFHFFGEARRIDPHHEYTVYCCAKELVVNALRHSGATNLNMQLIQSKKYVSLTVQDDGCGFDERTTEQGYGLQNIRNRLTSLKGKIDINSSPNNGTETTIEIRLQ